ncbi:MAG: hypothetical protein KAS01_01985 [Candidatus Pacebacteria bacterium]|nr:hypothetical protein [Candidatus Paceibacterota bacterium]
MKKISNFFYFALLSLFVMTKKASAAVSVNIANPIQTSDFSVLVGNVLQWVLSVAGSVSLLMLVAGGIMYVTSAGDEQKIATSKKLITWTIFGLMVVLASYSIIVVLDSILTD